MYTEELVHKSPVALAWRRKRMKFTPSVLSGESSRENYILSTGHSLGYLIIALSVSLSDFTTL